MLLGRRRRRRLLPVLVFRKHLLTQCSAVGGSGRLLSAFGPFSAPGPHVRFCSQQTHHDRRAEPPRIQYTQSSAANSSPHGSAENKASVWEIVRSVFRSGDRDPSVSDEGEKAKADAPKATRTTLVRMATFAWPERWPLGIAVGSVSITATISLVFPWAIGQVLDLAMAPDAPLTPTSVAGGLFFLFLFQSGLIVMRSGLLAVSGERIAASLRADLFRSMLRKELAFFDANRTGDLMNRLSSDTVVVQKALTGNLTSALRSTFMTVGGTVALLYLSPQLAFLSLALIPPVGLGARYFGGFVKRQQAAVQRELGSTLEVAEEVLGSIRTVRQFAAENAEMSRFNQAVGRAFEQARRVGIASAFFDGAVHYAANLAVIAVLWYGGSLVSSGAMTAGDLTAFLMYSLYTGFNITQLSSIYADMMRGVGASQRLLEILDRPSAMSLDGGRVLDRVEGHLTLESVTFAYPQRQGNAVLRNISLSIRPGQKVALVGASGSGKSTIGSLLTRLYDPQQGTVCLDGHPLPSLDPTWLRDRVIGTVPQEPTLFAGTILDNIRYAQPSASFEEVENAARLANAHEFIQSFSSGYETLVGERGVQLSGGQRQRIALARVILKSPPVILLDEATSALDGESEAAIQDSLHKVVEGRTVISIAHRLSTMRMADVVAVLEEGEIVEFGSFHELLAKPHGALRQLVARQLLDVSNRSHDIVWDDEAEGIRAEEENPVGEKEPPVIRRP